MAKKNITPTKTLAEIRAESEAAQAAMDAEIAAHIAAEVSKGGTITATSYVDEETGATRPVRSGAFLATVPLNYL